VRPITKSDYLAGLQCALRFWNRHYAPIPHEQRVETPAMGAGISVGQLAHQLFPGGVLVEAEPWEREESVTRTRELLADQNVSAIFEAGLLHDGLYARVDVLQRKPLGALALYEVKSGTFPIWRSKFMSPAEADLRLAKPESFTSTRNTNAVSNSTCTAFSLTRTKLHGWSSTSPVSTK
jgi:hypothetical protein